MGPQHVRCGMPACGVHDHLYGRPSMGPQHVRCGMPVKFRLSACGSLLQWGRNMFVAEWIESLTSLFMLTMPSMGPQHVRCGMP